MTDNEVIKALNYYAKQMDDGYRTHLEHGGKKDDALENDYDALCSALDLVNRQKVEIERLNIELEAMRSAANSLKLHYENAKSEAVKEFAKKFEDRIEKRLESTYKAWIAVDDILVEESKMHISAERAIKKIRECLNRYEPIGYSELVLMIERIVKEMTEENENDRT